MNSKTILTTTAVLLLGLALQCNQFPTRYDRIEQDVLRSIGFSYSPYAEGAPGDTIRVRAYFGGEKVVSVSWMYSIDHVVDMYGTDTILNLKEIPLIGESSRLPDSIDISFVVPDSTFFTTKGISTQALGMARAGLPQGMKSMTQQELAAFLQDLVAVDFNDLTTAIPFIDRWGGAMGISTLDSAAFSTLISIGGSLLYAFSVPGIIYATAISETGKKLKIKGDFAIRYNRKFLNTPFASLIPVNRNPRIRWFGVYAVKGKGAAMFYPEDTAYAGKFTFSYLYNEMFPDSVSDTVLIDTGYTYFFAADSGMVKYTLQAGSRVIDSISGTDTTWRTLAADSTAADTSRDKYFVPEAKDSFELETWFYDWQYENLDLDSVSDPLDSLFILAGGGGSSIIMALPSLNTKMTHTRIWTTVLDSYIGELNRPVGITIRVTDVYFRYSEAYVESRQ
jgi:hypothetical protein